MSEADNQKEDLQHEPAPAELPSASAPRKSGGGAALALSSLALIIGLAGAGIGGYTYWLRYQESLQPPAAVEPDAELLGRIERNAQLLGQLEASIRQDGRIEALGQQVNERFEAFPSADELNERRRLLGTLQSDQQRLSVRVERVLGASREDWRLAESEHLLRMAMLRLSAMQDVKSAAALIHEADLILQKQDDPGSYSARQKLLQSQEALRSLPRIDRTGLFLQLGAIRGLIAKLDSMAPEYKVTMDPVPATEGLNPTQAEWWQRWADEFSRYIRLDLDAVNNIKPLLAGQSLAQVRLALGLAIEQAQWAVLNGNADVYKQSLAQARAMLKEHFAADDLNSQALSSRIGELSGERVSVELPDLTPALRALEAYIDERQQATEAANKATQKDAAREALIGEEEVRA